VHAKQAKPAQIGGKLARGHTLFEPLGDVGFYLVLHE